MNFILRLTLLLAAITLSLSGCSSMQEKQVSELREAVEAPIDVAQNEPICPKPELIIAEPTPIYTAPEPFAAKLYFLLDKVEFTAESELESQDIYQEILKRNPTEVMISGHTDTSASNSYNEALSQRRAERVKQDLIEVGIDANSISIISEGEYRLLVQTPDETVEVRNRRVEITLR